MAQVITTTFKLKRGLAAAWEKTNPVLAQGEPGFVLDKNLLKIGDGATAWNDLPYLSETEASISPDGASIAVADNGNLIIYGFEDAITNQVPVKNSQGKLEWRTLSDVAFSGDIKDMVQTETVEFYGGSATEVLG